MQIKCDKCGGKGKVELHEPYLSMISILERDGNMMPIALHAKLRELDSKMPATSRFGFANVKTTAINNRLEFLRDLQLVHRVKVGRSWQYGAGKG